MAESGPTRRSLLGAAAFAPLALVRARFERDLGPRAEDLPTRDDYTLDPSITYLNHASTGTIPKAVQEARAGYHSACESNPWLYMWSGEWEGGIERTRREAGEMLGCAPEEVVIDRNTTDGFHLLASGVPLDAGDEVLFSDLNHIGASAAWERYGAERGYRVRRFSIPRDDVATMTAERLVERYVEQIRDDTAALVFPHVDNTVGLRHPVAALARAAKAAGVRWVAVDGAQVLGALPLDLGAAPDVDAYCCSPHKWVQGSKGIGLMFVRAARQAELSPQFVTWGQTRWQGTVRRFEDYGTRNLPEVLSLGDSLAFQRSHGVDRGAAKLRELRAQLRAIVTEQPKLRWRSPEDFELGAPLYAVEVEGASAPELAERLWREHRVVVRGFGGASNHLRISPNLADDRTSLEVLVRALRALGAI